MEKRSMYREALLSQGACNLSGLAHSLAGIMEQIWEENRHLAPQAQGTDYVNRHPVVRLFLEQMVYLNGGMYQEQTGYSYHEASSVCENMSKKEEQKDGGKN